MQQQGLRAVGVTEEGEGRGEVSRGEEELRSHGVFKIATGYDFFLTDHNSINNIIKLYNVKS